MAKTLSAMLPLGTIAPSFSLMDVVSQQMVSMNQSTTHTATVILFICNHCPYVKHINASLVQLANDYLNKNIRFIAINSNDAKQYPDDSPAHMQETAITLGYPFPYVFDETQEVALAYQAACTPDFFIFNHNNALVYRGQFDDSRPGNHVIVNGESIRLALDCLLAGIPVPEHQKPSLGCNIKWKTI